MSVVDSLFEIRSLVDYVVIGGVVVYGVVGITLLLFLWWTSKRP